MHSAPASFVCVRARLCVCARASTGKREKKVSERGTGRETTDAGSCSPFCQGCFSLLATTIDLARRHFYWIKRKLSHSPPLAHVKHSEQQLLPPRAETETDTVRRRRAGGMDASAGERFTRGSTVTHRLPSRTCVLAKCLRSYPVEEESFIPAFQLHLMS